MLSSRLSLLSLLAAVFCAALAAAPAHAQQQQQSDSSSQPPSHNLDFFAPVDFLPPNDYRAASGRPGPDYWQNAADYQIQVTLDTTAHRLSGSETITYTNNSPQDLSYLWVQLDQNLFDPESRGAKIVPPSQRFSGSFEEGGYDIQNVALVRGGERSEPQMTISDTRMRIALDEPLEADGGTVDIEIDFAFTLPEYGADRNGRLGVQDGTIYEVAQWYPRMYVFDDVNGWNAMPYLGQGEYYLEYGTFDVEITAPRNMILAATGTLENPGDVLTAEQQRRLDEARQSRERVFVIDSTEVGQAGTRPEGEGPLTWRYRAEDVRDFSWAASQAFIWDAARAETGDGNYALAQSVYPVEGIGTEQNPGWERSTAFTQHAIEFYSDFLVPYPYPVAINVAGIVRGMEYPQIVFCSVQARGPSLFGVTDHEFGHEWFPMVVGSDERRHAWMDEGLNSFINYYSTRAFYEQDPMQAQQAYIGRILEQMADRAADQPIATYADRIRSEDLGFLAYRKPAAGLIILREYLLDSPEIFDSAFEAYVDRWAYQHPQPADFFRTIEDVSGEDLDWFWRGWFYTNDQLDQAITAVEAQGDTTRVTLANEAGLVLPVEMAITYEDGATERVRIPVEAFYTGDAYTTLLTGGPVQRLVLNPSGILPDVDASNNTWTPDGGIGGSAPSSSSPQR